MRILVAIPHYVRPTGDDRYAQRPHGALDGGPAPRIEALSACLTALHSLFHPEHCLIDHGRRHARLAPAAVPHFLDVAICTTGGRHILDQLPVAARYYTHHETAAPPELLGFACHDFLRERLGQYDYYCYLEDDMVLHDPWFFVKLAWFNATVGDDNVLQPNRFEAGLNHLVPKVYVDGALGPTAPLLSWRVARCRRWSLRYWGSALPSSGRRIRTPAASSSMPGRWLTGSHSRTLRIDNRVSLDRWRRPPRWEFCARFASTKRRR